MDYEDYNKSIDTPAEKSLVKLHRNVIHAMQTNTRHQTQWSNMMAKAFRLEDVIMNETSIDRRYKHSFSEGRPSFIRNIYTPTAGNVNSIDRRYKHSFSEGRSSFIRNIYCPQKVGDIGT